MTKNLSQSQALDKNEICDFLHTKQEHSRAATVSSLLYFQIINLHVTEMFFEGYICMLAREAGSASKAL
jgi:hypothetical protein